MDRDTFTSVFGGVFEDSAWAASQAWQQLPFSSAEALIEAMCQSVKEADYDTQLALLRAHPELGTNNDMTQTSAAEQTTAGIRHGSDHRQALLKELNRAYREKFGFPFIVAVKGMTMEKIVENLQSRLNNDRETEFATCLEQVFNIARFRLHDLLDKG